MPNRVFYETEIYDVQLDIFLNKPSGWLWQELERRHKKAIGAAQRNVGVRTGALRKSIRGYHLSNQTGHYLGITASKPYALMHHEGTKPHVILPKNGRLLRFSRGTQVIFTEMVRHPGTKPNRFLSNQLIHYRG
jgi:hypothetical protein